MAIMQGQIIAGRMQHARDRRADAFGGTGDQGNRARNGDWGHFLPLRSNVAVWTRPLGPECKPRVDIASMRLELPEPSPDERAHSERLAALIRAEIAAAGGALDFARYMELALYAPGLGYYSA